jgi:hypothetical protein
MGSYIWWEDEILTMSVEILALIIKWVVLIFLYIIVGFGMGFIVGVMVANRVFGKGKPLRMDSHDNAVRKASEHNKQWHPDNERWQK